MPGPNDHHIRMEKDAEGKERPVLHEGLGADEPSEERRAGMRAAGSKKIEELRAKLEAKGLALTEQQRIAVQKEQELERRERELVAKEEAFQRALRAADRERGNDSADDSASSDDGSDDDGSH